MKRVLQHFFSGLVMLAASLISSPAGAHDAIDSVTRKSYVAKLQEWHAIFQSSAPTSVRAKAQYQIAITLDEIRELLNQDIVSHGAVKGLETSLLLNELARSEDKLELSPKTGLYISHLQIYRDAIKLDPKAPFLNHARYMLMKSHFYDSFSDNPLTPLSQSKEELAAMIAIGEGLLKIKDPLVTIEEVRFILAIHYLQAINQKLIAKDEGEKKFKKLAQDLRKDNPQSLKLLTLEALLE